MKQYLHKAENKLYEGANPAQIAAITHESGPVMCLAGPGSGKTFVLTRHIRYLIKEKYIKPHHILVITFSKASAYEMQKRLEGSVRQCLSFESICNIPIYIPSVEEQYKIGKNISILLDKIDVETNYRSKFEEQKRYLLRQMFI